MNYTIVDCEKRAKEHPDTFLIATASARKGIPVGWIAKLIFELLPNAKARTVNRSDWISPPPPNAELPSGERMWVVITERNGERYRGTLESRPVIVDAVQGDVIEFGPEHIADFAAPIDRN